MPFRLSAAAAPRHTPPRPACTHSRLPAALPLLLPTACAAAGSQLEDPFDLLPCTQIIQLALRDANRVFNDVAFLRGLAEDAEPPAENGAEDTAEPLAAASNVTQAAGAGHVALKLA